MVVKINYQSG